MKLLNNKEMLLLLAASCFHMDRFAYVCKYLHIYKCTQVYKSVHVNGITHVCKICTICRFLDLRLVETKCKFQFVYIHKFCIYTNLSM